MLQMIKCILITSTMYITYAEMIYPILNKAYKTQWEDNVWINCETKSDIQPKKCYEGELDWQECYEVPKEGICLANYITTTQQDLLQFNITFNTSANNNTNQGQIVEIEINKNSLQLQLLNYSILEKVKIDSNIISLKILTSSLVLSDLSIYTPNHITHSQNELSVCLNEYSLFNYKCIPQSCFDQISNINSDTHISSISQIEQNTTNLLIKSTFKIPLIECLIPKIYLTKSIEDNTITTILSDEQVKLNENDNSILEYYLTPEQFQKCYHFETQQAIVYQCFIGVAITINKKPQYLLMLISQIEVQKSTQTYTNSIQIFEMPTSDTESTIVGPIIIFSNASNSIIDTKNNLIETTQNILDPNYQDYQITFLNGTITQNLTIIPLKLEDERQNGSIKELILSYDNNNFNENQNYNISISSSLTLNQTRRLLGQRNIIPQMQIQNSFDGTKVSQSTVTFNVNQQSSLQGGYLALIFIAVILCSLFFIIATIVLIEKVENKYFKIKQKEDKQIPTELQQN
ncbi:unnamed protein product [Paramecium pentaurelia]|uniref:Transmembrane protein n=1 Tax=Paramecium pentaurelia TaxID=43138 RepID=A0A8S1XPZ7_9CILI|nr:unnamed protein product [Paramecium pentaurelia]